MSYAKTVAEIREMIREDIDLDGIETVFDSYGFGDDIVDLTEDEAVEMMVARELDIMGK